MYVDQRILCVTALIGIGISGCSNLEARKVPNQCRAVEQDCDEGFRYYLNRPYLIVKAPVLISERKSLVLGGDLPNSAVIVTTEISRARADSGASSSPTLGTLTAPTEIALTGNLQIVYLPDLDEQYVIQSKNCLAKTNFALTFANGTELTQVDGDHDATTLTVELLSQIQNAISTASGVAQEEYKHSSTSTSTQDKATQNTAKALGQPATVDRTLYRKVERTSIKPGMYRLQKPWEMDDGSGLMPIGTGFLAKLGLPTTTDVYYEALTGDD